MINSRQSFQALRQKITVEWPNSTLKNAHDVLVQTARKGNEEILNDQVARSGITPGVTSYANNPGNTNIDNVQLPGPIVFRYDYRKEIVAYALNALRDASPVESGKYRSSHTIYLNGSSVSELPDELGDDDEIIISNPVPYARRLEIGRTKSGRSFVARVQPRIYERVAKSDVIKRYHNIAKITFSYVELSGAWVTKGGLSRYYKTQKLRLHKGKLGAAGELSLRKRYQNPGEKIKAPALIIEAYK